MISKIALAQASHEQLVEFAACEGVELSDPMRSESGVGALRELLERAGHRTGIYVASAPITLAAAKTGVSPDDAFDPENERWVKFMIAPDDAGEEVMALSCVYVSVNNDWAHVPRGEQVILRELLFRHLQVKETRWTQKVDGPQISRRRTARVVDRYPMTMYGYVGYVNNGPPENLGDEILIAKGGTQAAAISMAQQRSRMAMAG